jgi:ADP-L-glycero-D-manno-heptose 6-epimerase
MIGEGIIEYASFPDALKGKYQHFTEANITALREAGYQQPFLTVEQGVSSYCRWLLERSRAE